jgi:DNA-binding LacI/PurR family transcriptional regulator
MRLPCQYNMVRKSFFLGWLIDLKHTVLTIASDLGVAPSTISKIIHHTGNFSDELRVKVLDYVRSVGYVPASSARILKSRKTWTIGVVYTEESRIGLEHPFFSAILQSFKNYIEKAGYDLCFIVKQIGDNHMSYLNWCRNKKVDGVLIVVGSHNNPELIELVESEIPCVSTDVVRDHLQTIVSDNDQGIRISIDHAIKLGAKRIGMIAGPLTARHFLYRFTKFKQVLIDRGYEYDEQTVISAKGFGYSSGYEAALTLLSRPGRVPDVLLVGSDLLAFGVIHAIQERGYHVPDDIQIIGYDDISFAHMFAPKLTTIRQNTEQIGIKAAEILLHMIDSNLPNEAAIHRIPVELVERETTKRTVVSNQNHS